MIGHDAFAVAAVNYPAKHPVRQNPDKLSGLLSTVDKICSATLRCSLHCSFQMHKRAVPPLLGSRVQDTSQGLGALLGQGLVMLS